MLFVVSGYPASGKSTWCHERVKQSPGAILFDMDAMRAAITVSGEHDQRMAQTIGRLLNDTAHQWEQSFTAYGLEHMYLIRMAPTDTEAEAYAASDQACMILIDTPKDICLERVKLRGDYDLMAFGKACGRVDRFRDRFKDSLTLAV